MNCFNCEMERACKPCLDLISQKKAYSTDIKMLTRKPANEYLPMLPHYESGYEPKQNIIDLESAREFLMEREYKMIMKRRSERICNKMQCKLYMKNEDIPGNKEIFVYGFKHIKTDKFEKNVIIGRESDELYENVELFNFWSNKVINKEREMRNFKRTGWSFMTLVKRNNCFKILGTCI